MSSTIWRFWEDNRTEKEVKTKNQYKRYKKPAVSEKVHQLVSDFTAIFANQSREKMVLQKKPLKH